jgi:hypothetical protein
MGPVRQDRYYKSTAVQKVDAFRTAAFRGKAYDLLSVSTKSQSLGDASPVCWVGSGEVLDHLFLYLDGHFAQAADNGCDRALLLFWRHQAEQVSRLDVIIVDTAFLVVTAGIA